MSDLMDVFREMFDRFSREHVSNMAAIGADLSWWFPQPKEDSMTREMVEKAFQYYPPKPHTKAAYEKLHAAFASIALLVQDLCPESREKSLAITHLQEGRMCANAAIAVHGQSASYTIDGVTHSPELPPVEPASTPSSDALNSALSGESNG